jgi:putative sterol carrier protein
MSGFANAEEARQIITALFQQPITSSLRKLQIVYSYRFTDIDWSCTVVLRTGTAQVFEGILPESETTIETSTIIFDRLMTGQINPISVHLSNQARILGSLGNALKLRTLLPALTEAYKVVMAQRATSAGLQTQSLPDVPPVGH